MKKFAPMALLIEDDVVIRGFVRTALEENGWQVSEAPTLAHAHAFASAHAPDLIVLDLGTPDGEGVDFIGEIRQRSNVPIFVLAARVDDSEKMRALQAGATDYSSKLFGIGERFSAALRRLRPHSSHQNG